jgi:hypothetical protein
VSRRRDSVKRHADQDRPVSAPQPHRTQAGIRRWNNGSNYATIMRRGDGIKFAVFCTKPCSRLSPPAHGGESLADNREDQ